MRPLKRSQCRRQAQRFHGFLWASGGVFSDFYVHHVDEVCWMKNAWPVKVEAIGGRHFRGKLDDQNFDSYGVEYTFADDLTAGVAELTDDSPALLQRGPDGLYPVPMPGRFKYEFRS